MYMYMKVLSVSKPEDWDRDYRINVQWRRKRWFRGVETGAEVFRGRPTVFMSVTTGRRPGTLIESFLSDVVQWSSWGYPPSSFWHRVSRKRGST